MIVTVYTCIYHAVYTFFYCVSYVMYLFELVSASCVLLDINLLKPSRIEFVLDPVPPLTLPDGAAPPKWLEYIYRTAHPTLRWLPTKLAEWIGENMQEELGFPNKADKRAQPGSGWTPA